MALVMSEPEPESNGHYFVDDLGSDPYHRAVEILDAAKWWITTTDDIDALIDALRKAQSYDEAIQASGLKTWKRRAPALEIQRRIERRLGQLEREGRLYFNITRHPIPAKKATTRQLNVNGQVATQMRVLGAASAEQFEAVILRCITQGRLSRQQVADLITGRRSLSPLSSLDPKRVRSEWHTKKRHFNANRIIEQLAGQLVSAATGLEHLDPDNLDREKARVWFASIQESTDTINRYLRKWRQ